MGRLTSVGAIVILIISTIFIVAGWKGTYREVWSSITQAASRTPSRAGVNG